MPDDYMQRLEEARDRPPRCAPGSDPSLRKGPWELPLLPLTLGSRLPESREEAGRGAHANATRPAPYLSAASLTVVRIGHANDNSGGRDPDTTLPSLYEALADQRTPL